jgi:hypothetical protein
MDALHRSTCVDFRLTCFSILRFFCDLLRIFKVSIDMILLLKSIGKNLYEIILTETCHIMDALHRSTREEFRST